MCITHIRLYYAFYYSTQFMITQGNNTSYKLVTSLEMREASQTLQKVNFCHRYITHIQSIYKSILCEYAYIMLKLIVGFHFHPSGLYYPQFMNLSYDTEFLRSKLWDNENTLTYEKIMCLFFVRVGKNRAWDVSDTKVAFCP